MKHTLSIWFWTQLFMCSIAMAQVKRGLEIEGLSGSNYSGYSVNMPHKNMIAVGEPFSDLGATDAGLVRVFKWDGSNWIQKGTNILGEASTDLSGYVVQMPDTNTVAVGTLYNDANGNNSGHVRVFRWDGSNWSQKGIDLDGLNADDRFGISLWMSDSNHIAIGGIGNDNNGMDKGHVRVFEWNGANWIQMGTDIFGETNGDEFGFAVSYPDKFTVAASSRANDAGGNDAGQIRIFKWNGSNWILKGNPIYGENPGDLAGNAIAMPDSNNIIIGSVYNDGAASDAGHARVFRWNGTAWVQRGSDIDGLLKDNYCGWSVAMPNENTLAVGMPYNDLKSYRAGSARVFVWKDNKWVQRGSNINGTASSDFCGRTVHMPDPNTLAVGSPYRDKFGSDRGETRVFDLCFEDGYALSFDGINDYVDCGKNAATQQVGNFTLELRMKMDSMTAFYSAFAGNFFDSSSHTRGYWLGTDGFGKAIFFIGDNSAVGNYLSSNVKIVDGEWHLISAVYTGDSMKVYVDGLLEGKRSVVNGYLASNFAFWLGNDANNEVFKGKLDDVRIWNKVRTDAEILADYNGCIKGNESNLVAYYQFDSDKFTSKVKDFSGNNIHGTIKNADTTLIFNSGTCCYKCDFVSNSSASALTKKTCKNYTSPSGKYNWTVSGAYKDTLSNAIGCDSIISIALTINNATSSSNNVTSCFKYRSPSGKYNWTKSGTYNDTIANFSGCDSILTIQLGIDTVDIVVTNSSPKLTANATAAAYQWLDCKNNYSKINGATNASYTATAIGNYAVEITQKGCIDTSDCLVVKSLSVQNNGYHHKVVYYTNPSNELCLIQFNEIQENIKVSIMNDLGAEVSSLSCTNSNQLKVQLPESAGFYFIQLSNENFKTTLKVLKQ